MESKYAFLLAFLITGLIASNVFVFSVINKPQKETVLITKIIDGDTFETSEGTKIRLDNINAPEKNHLGYVEAKKFLLRFENKTIEIEKISTDKYKRTLARAYAPEYLNLEIVKQGLATKFLVNKQEVKLFAQAEESAIKSELGIWKKSSYFGCFESKISPNEEIIFIKNNCPKINIKDWGIKDESRKEYNFQDISLGQVNLHTFSGQDNETDIFWGSNKDIWNNDRDSLYLFDAQRNLAHYQFYGY